MMLYQSLRNTDGGDGWRQRKRARSRRGAGERQRRLQVQSHCPWSRTRRIERRRPASDVSGDGDHRRGKHGSWEEDQGRGKRES